MTTMTAAPGVTKPDLAAQRQARQESLLASFDPTVPGIPGDGSPIVLHTDTEHPVGPLTYRWYNISRRIQDFSSRERGFLVSRLSVTYRTPSGEDIEVAYLNITHTTPELVAAEFPTPFHWADENTSASFGFNYAANQSRDITDAELWASAYNHLSIRPASMDGKVNWAYSDRDAPSDPKVLAGELAAARKVYATQMRGFVRWLSTPFVDHSHVDNDFDAMRKGNPEHPGDLRYTGIGRRMYLLVAQHLATHGKVLRASGIQSPDAEAIWKRLAADPSVPTRKTRVTFYKPCAQRTKAYLCIDYTRAAQESTDE